MQAHNPKPYGKSDSVVIVDETTGCVICSEGNLANTFRTRLFGLLGRKKIAAGGGLLIQPSSGVHTFGMSFPIDIVSLDRNRRVIGLFHNTQAWKIRGLSFKTCSVLELPAGRIMECGIEQGNQIVVDNKLPAGQAV